MTSPAVDSLLKDARAAANQADSIDERMRIFRLMIDSLMGEYDALRLEREQLRKQARVIADDARSIARAEARL